MRLIKKNQPSNQIVGDFLRKKRKEKMISGTEMGRLIHVSQQQVSRYENGKTNLTIEVLSNYLTILNISWIDFIYSVGLESELKLNKEENYY